MENSSGIKRISRIYIIHVIIFWFSCHRRCEGRTFKRKDILQNTRITALSVYSHSGCRSTLECSAKCSWEKECVSFFYNTRSGQCTGHAVQFYSTDPVSPEEGSVFYARPIDKRDCAEILELYPDSPDGVYIINPLDGKGHFRVYCDMTTDGGGWTVFQRRQDGSEDFYRNWNDYKNGFGALEGEFWLGNDYINRLSTTRSVQLRVNLGDYDGRSRYAKFSTFKVDNEGNNYRIKVSGCSGTAGDSLSYHDGMQFTTKDRDNDYMYKDYNCAVKWVGAWWYKYCHKTNLNGKYGATGYGNGLIWQTFREMNYSLKITELMLKPVNYPILFE